MDTPTAAVPNPNAETRTAVVLDDGSEAVQATQSLLAKQGYATAYMTTDAPVDSLSSIEALCEVLRHAMSFAQQQGARLVSLPLTAEAALLRIVPVHELFSALHGVVESARLAGVVEDMMLAAPFVNETLATVVGLSRAVADTASAVQAVESAAKPQKANTAAASSK